MASKTEISNLALSHLGSGKEISDLDTDRSSEGAACLHQLRCGLLQTNGIGVLNGK